MTDIKRPRRGSMAFRPRKRAEKQTPRVYWYPHQNIRVLGFAGYKVGMTQCAYVDVSQSATKGQEIINAATVLEVPPILVYGIRYYDREKSLWDELISDENILKKMKIKKTKKTTPQNPDAIKDVRLLAFVQPDKTSIGKKHIERLELGLGGKDVKEKLNYARSLLGKEIRAKDVFKTGELIDAVAITKGHGWQGAVKRFGIATQRRKATGKYRHVGTLGQWHPAYVLYTVPQAGQTGYHKRTELNKQILQIGEKAEQINPKGGFPHYGLVKNDYLLIKGSLPGPVKRLLKIRLAVRNQKMPQEIPVVSYVSLQSKQ